jgi:hypothetical protein
MESRGTSLTSFWNNSNTLSVYTFATWFSIGDFFRFNLGNFCIELYFASYSLLHFCLTSLSKLVKNSSILRSIGKQSLKSQLNLSLSCVLLIPAVNVLFTYDWAHVSFNLNISISHLFSWASYFSNMIFQVERKCDALPDGQIN